MKTQIIAVLVLAVVALIFWWGVVNNRLAESALTGVWVARDDDDFCRASSIDAMMLVIGEPVASTTWLSRAGQYFPWSKTTRPCALTIFDNIYSGFFDLVYRRGLTWNASKYVVTAELDYDATSTPLWEGPVRITVDTANGLMVVVDSLEEVVAVLVRDNAITETSRA